VSKSLSIKCDPIDQPAALDPVEGRTWSALYIRVRGRTVTRIWDTKLQEERSLIYLPVFPIAEWIVSNWWTLLNEPPPSAELAKFSSTRLPWIKRHCLRSAESGLLLPLLYLFNDGRGIRAEWQADEPGALRNMPGEFVDSGHDYLERSEVEDVLAEFVSEVLQRTEKLNDERIKQLKENWGAIRGVDAEEAKFCTATGRMGLDPYDSNLPSELADFLETNIPDPDLPLVRDFTEAAQSDAVAEQWSWVQKCKADWKLGPIVIQLPIQPGDFSPSPFQHGYQLATKIRAAAGLDSLAPLPSVEDVAKKVSGRAIRIQDQNHVPGQKIRAVVGWSPENEIVLAGPMSPRKDNQRFLAACGLYHGLFSCDRSERLLTHAFTWDQQASRAFAAELLAPQAALIAQAGEMVERSKVDELASHFEASSVVIEKQLENAGVTLIDE